MKENLKEYAELKVEEKRISERLDVLKPLIVEEMRKIDAEKIESEFGNFTLSSQSRWTYSEAVATLQEEEKAKGIAKQVVSTILRFTGLKTK